MTGIAITDLGSALAPQAGVLLNRHDRAPLGGCVARREPQPQVAAAGFGVPATTEIVDAHEAP